MLKVVCQPNTPIKVQNKNIPPTTQQSTKASVL